MTQRRRRFAAAFLACDVPNGSCRISSPDRAMRQAPRANGLIFACSMASIPSPQNGLLRPVIS